MPITTLLKDVLDTRKGGTECDFNGYLEDYLEMMEETDPFRSILTTIFEQDNDCRVCVNYRIALNRTVISNQIIRYKDAFKLEDLRVVCPLIVYSERDGQQRGLMIYDANDKNYLYAKGMYYCFTEPGSPFADCKNELVSVVNNDEKEVASIYSRLYTYKAGALQREFDKTCFNNYEQLKSEAVAESVALKENAAETVNSVEDPQNVIYAMIQKWFLLKKVCYVQYMVSKDLLNSVHEGNIKKQRNQAKVNADSIVFVPYSELWRMKKPAAK